MSESNRTVLAWLSAIGGAVALGVLLASAVWSPEAMAEGVPLRFVGLVPETCPGCPLCGMSRAFAWMTRGDPGEAVGLNPGVLFAYPLAVGLAVAGPAYSLRTLRERRLKCAKSPRS